MDGRRNLICGMALRLGTSGHQLRGPLHLGGSVGQDARQRGHMRRFLPDASHTRRHPLQEAIERPGQLGQFALPVHRETRGHVALEQNLPETGQGPQDTSGDGPYAQGQQHKDTREQPPPDPETVGSAHHKPRCQA